MTPNGLEARDAAASTVAVKPRVTLDQIKSLVVGERYFTDETLTICVLTLTNGYKVTGESAAAHPSNFNEEMGRKIAREKAIGEIWPLAGFLLRDTLHRGENPAVMRAKVVLNTKTAAYRQAPWDNKGKPRGRYTEEPYEYKDHRGDTIKGVRTIIDETDPSNIILDGENLHFHAVCPPTCDPNGAKENLIFGEMTPIFMVQMLVRNQSVLKSLRHGEAYYVDFIPVPASPKAG